LQAAFLTTNNWFVFLLFQTNLVESHVTSSASVITSLNRHGQAEV